MNDLLTPELINQAVIPILFSFGSLVISVFAGFLFLNNRNKKEINRVDARNVEITTENEQFREDLRVKEDTLHALRRELDDLRAKLNERESRLDLLTQQFTALNDRATKLEDRITETQNQLESERKFAQGRVDAESGARQKAELKATELQAEVKVLRMEKDALAQRLEDQANLHKAEMAALHEQTARLETESRMLSASIEDRIRTVTAPLVAQIEALKSERAALENRICELETKGTDPDA